MSSQSYRDRSLEEIRVLVDKYCENYKRLFGVTPDIEKLKARFNEMKKEKEEEIFRQSFFTLPAKSLCDCIAIADEIARASAEEMARPKPQPKETKAHKGKP